MKGLQVTHRISIIICTCNRAADLRQTLVSIGRVYVPENALADLIVVDNASTDGTAEVMQSCHLPDMPVRYIHEPRRGKGYAYNTGMAAAQGDVILFTDDDVRPHPEWLQKHLESYESRQVAAVIGRVQLEFDAPPPVWLDRVHRGFLAEVNYGDTLIFPYTGHLVGANMSFRRKAALEVGPFNTLLGPGRAGFWDDTEFSARLMQAGYEQLYQPQAIVKHQIASSRLTPAYFRNAAFRNGTSSYIAMQSGALGDISNPTKHFIRNSWRKAKWEAKHFLKRSRPICSQAELFYQMDCGGMWAHLQRMLRLQKRYSQTR